MLKKLLFLLCLSSIWASSLKPVKDLGPRIINGDSTVPWQAGLQVSAWTYGWFCGGSIISEEWILYGVLAWVTVGSVTIPNSDNEHLSTHLVLHEGYNSDTLANDIGLLKLKVALTFNDNIKPIALASDALGAGVDVTVSGWGLTHDGDSAISSNLYYITIRTITNQECEQSYGQGSILDGMVCAEYVGDRVESPCSGDSGGPVVTDAASNPVHVAVVSFVSDAGCETSTPAGFTRTAFHIDWIRENSGV